MKTRPRIAAPIAVALAVGGTLAAATPAQAATTTCATRWGSLDKGVNLAGEKAGGALKGQRYGHHTCFDRTVIDIAGPVGATRVGYVARSTSGAAVLAVVVRHDSPAAFGGACAAIGLAMPTIIGPGCVQGTTRYTTTSVTTRARLPFRIFTVKGPGATNRVVVDVAHRW